MSPASAPSEPRSGAAEGGRLVPIAGLALLVLVFTALGIWQVKRLAWKEALIARVDAATHAAPISAAQVSANPALNEYRRVTASGQYLGAGTALVTATTELGSGYWVLTPLRTGQGEIIYINRGFVAVGSKLGAIARATPADAVALTGLVRLTEPHGGLLRANRPEAERWYSRDIAAIARRRGIAVQTGWFIDAQAETPPPTPGLANSPVAGLTVVQFPNNHLAYALTWFTLAALSTVGIARIALPRRR